MTPPTPPEPAPDRAHRTAADPAAITILIDADACPVKEEVYRVAARFKAPLPEAHVRVVSNSPFRIPDNPRIKRVVVDDSFDAADDWIAQEAVRVSPRCVVITGDIPLADRCLKAGARVLKHNGSEFTPASIGGALATRAILEDLRAGMDGIGGGPPPFSKADRSQFLQSLDRVMMGLARG
ncbi:MAG: DUF188 domain-containing protein [Pseudomonadota bacterium]